MEKKTGQKRYGRYSQRAVQRMAVLVSITVVLLAATLVAAAIVWSERAASTAVSKTPDRASPFDGKRAYADARKIVGFGPRPPGSDALAHTRVFIKDELAKAGVSVREQAFEADTPIGKKAMVNLVGVVEGTKDGVIVLGNHYDTKHFSDRVFVGANDGGSTTAWMIEMARVLGAKREGRAVWLCFFDGEEAFGEWSKTNSLYGSRAFVDALRGKGELSQIKTMINVDMIGDCDLGIRQDRDAPDWMTQLVWGVAQRIGHGRSFLAFAHAIEDDHVPFRRAGVPALNVIDFNYGATAKEHAETWHTERDAIERICPESLQAVGDVIYHALPEIDRFLDRP